jgi:hypothetical protein
MLVEVRTKYETKTGNRIMMCLFLKRRELPLLVMAPLVLSSLLSTAQHHGSASSGSRLCVSGLTCITYFPEPSNSYTTSYLLSPSSTVRKSHIQS